MKYLNKIREDWIESYLVAMGEEPIGFLQLYEASKEKSGWWTDTLPGVYGIDMFLGSERHLGRGIGSKILKRFVQKLKENNSVCEFFSDPSPDNSKAIRVFEKAGFLNCGTVQTPDGAAVLMKCTFHPC